MNISYEITSLDGQFSSSVIGESVTLPRVGEYVAFSDGDKEWLKVNLVLHTAFPGPVDVVVYGKLVTIEEATNPN